MQVGRYKIKDFSFHLGEKISKKYPVIDRMTKDAWYLDDFKANHPFIYWIWWLFADCGRIFFRWAAWSIVFAFIFGAVFADYGAPDFLPDFIKQFLYCINPEFEISSTIRVPNGLLHIILVS